MYSLIWSKEAGRTTNFLYLYLSIFKEFQVITFSDPKYLILIMPLPLLMPSDRAQHYIICHLCSWFSFLADLPEVLFSSCIHLFLSWGWFSCTQIKSEIMAVLWTKTLHVSFGEKGKKESEEQSFFIWPQHPLLRIKQPVLQLREYSYCCWNVPCIFRKILLSKFIVTFFCLGNLCFFS